MTTDEKVRASSYVLGLVSAFIGGIFWLSSVASDAKEAKTEVRDLRILVEQTHDSTLRMEEQIKLLMHRGK